MGTITEQYGITGPLDTVLQECGKITVDMMRRGGEPTGAMERIAKAALEAAAERDAMIEALGLSQRAMAEALEHLNAWARQACVDAEAGDLVARLNANSAILARIKAAA